MSAFVRARRSRRPLQRVAALALASLLLAAPAWSQTSPNANALLPGDWHDPEAWKRLRLGMSPAQVVALLGEPGKVTVYYAFERWEYPDALGRRVNFDEQKKLSAWDPFAR